MHIGANLLQTPRCLDTQVKRRFLKDATQLPVVARMLSSPVVTGGVGGCSCLCPKCSSSRMRRLCCFPVNRRYFLGRKEANKREKQNGRCFIQYEWLLSTSSRELLRRRTDFLNYLPFCINRNTHLQPFPQVDPDQTRTELAGMTADRLLGSVIPYHWKKDCRLWSHVSPNTVWKKIYFCPAHNHITPGLWLNNTSLNQWDGCTGYTESHLKRHQHLKCQSKKVNRRRVTHHICNTRPIL